MIFQDLTVFKFQTYTYVHTYVYPMCLIYLAWNGPVSVSMMIPSVVTQTHSSHASERVWWTPASSLVQLIPRIWGALILYWLVVNNYTGGDDCHHYVTKPPLSPLKIKHRFLWNTLEYIVDIHCRLLTALKRDRESTSFGASRSKSRCWWWLCDVMAAIVTPCVVIHLQSVE